jgi:hypothetical protein
MDQYERHRYIVGRFEGGTDDELLLEAHDDAVITRRDRIVTPVMVGICATVIAIVAAVAGIEWLAWHGYISWPPMRS